MDEKELRKFIIMLIIIVLIEWGFILFLLTSRSKLERDLCEDWGGKLYEDNVCYLVKDLDKCIDQEGFIKENSRGLSIPSFPPPPPFSPNITIDGGYKNE